MQSGKYLLRYDRSVAASEDFGAEFSHDKAISVAVAISYRISEFEQS